MHAPISAQKQEARIAALHAEAESLQQELGENENADAIVKKHIKLLHRYNEAKDATQMTRDLLLDSSSFSEASFIPDSYRKACDNERNDGQADTR
ncbi:hypothetical protein C8R43DRAFT_1052343 [Mycena crocata]|nr:hypothetical protein C8R43DRAFT_1052343 [Mycena crocata]